MDETARQRQDFARLNGLFADADARIARGETTRQILGEVEHELADLVARTAQGVIRRVMDRFIANQASKPWYRTGERW